MVRLKASLQSSSKLIFKQFQFLMVRLKVEKVAEVPLFFPFQFLMVRLKVTPLYSFSKRVSDFNSLWCD